MLQVLRWRVQVLQ